jgi:hypothetical protein
MGYPRRFRHGQVLYPLTDDTTNSLLLDADPALFYAIQFFSSVLNTYVKPRLLMQAALEDYNLPSAVEATIAYEPTPFLLSGDFTWPLFCLYRVEDEWSRPNQSNPTCKSSWEWSYVLPPLTPQEIPEILPILRTAAVAISHAAMVGYDAGYENGATLRDLAGIVKMVPGRIKYGAFEPVDGEPKWWRAVSGQLSVEERDDFVLEDELDFAGADINLDLANKDVQTVVDFVQLVQQPKPVAEIVAPNSGTKAGGALFYVYGTGFVPGSDTKVLIGGAYASNVVVTHETKLQGYSPSHDAAPTYAADVQVIGPDGQVSDLLEAAYTFTTP